MSFVLNISLGVAAIAAAAVVFTTFQHPPVISVQRGFRGVALEQNYDPNLVEASLANNFIPKTLPKLPAAGPKAGVVYKNVKVLGDLSVGQFTRLMASMTTWVAPVQGCAYCHNVHNMADDSLYTKVVARRMIQMVQNINGNWQSHIQAVGVTCWTCHRGNPVPKNIWFTDPGPGAKLGGMAESATGAGTVSVAAGGSSLPYDPFTPYLLGDENIRVQGNTPLPVDNLHTIKQTEWTYALMIHFANALGVNCTYCHNSRAFSDWSQSTPQRTTAWWGIRMVRDLNVAYLTPLTSVFPPYRLGITGDAPKVNCATCHQGIYKPLYGVSMIKDFPELAAPSRVSASALVPAHATGTP
jgi:photosynthetic reaction center cytochrome c subunit